MSHSGTPAARGHLRLAGPPAEPRRVAESKALLLLRGAAATLALALLTVLASIPVALAVLPLLWRRGPMGVRLRPLRGCEARIIPFERPRQRALPH